MITVMTLKLEAEEDGAKHSTHIATLFACVNCLVYTSKMTMFKVAGNPVFSRSTNLESKLIKFFVFVSAQSVLGVFIRSLSVKFSPFPVGIDIQ